MRRLQKQNPVDQQDSRNSGPSPASPGWPGEPDSPSEPLTWFAGRGAARRMRSGTPASGACTLPVGGTEVPIRPRRGSRGPGQTDGLREVCTQSRERVGPPGPEAWAADTDSSSGDRLGPQPRATPAHLSGHQGRAPSDLVGLRTG